MAVTALTASKIFDGETMLTQHAVLIDGRLIAKVLPLRDVGNMKINDLGAGILAPGFVDVQVNGGGGALLNNPTIANVSTIANSHRKYGTVAMLPTVITDAPDVIAKAVRAVVEAQKQGATSVIGIHIEGPHLDVARKGAHDANFIRALTSDDLALYSRNDCGITMITVAPNVVMPRQIEALSKAGVLVSLGHSDATVEEARNALSAGATSFTHLFNAMSQITPRDPGMVGASIESRSAFASIIADGHHVHDTNLKLAISTKGTNRIMIITDAMPTAAGGPDTFELQGRVVTRRGTRLSLDDDTLAGSDLSMDRAVRYAVQKLGLSVPEVLRMASLTPAMFLKRDHTLGRIKKGYLASLVHLDEALNVRQVWVEGR